MYAWLIRDNVSDSEHNQSKIKHTLRHSYDPQCFSILRGLQLMSSVVLDVFVS